MTKNFQQSISSLFRLQAFSKKAFVSCERNFYLFFQKWILNSFEIVLQPTMYFLAFGFGLEHWIANLEGLSYPRYVFYGILCATAMSTSIFESSQSLYERYFEKEQYRLINAFPVSFQEVFLGECLWASLRSILACSLFMLVGSSFDMVASVDFLPVLLVCTWLSLVFSSLGLWIAAVSKSYSRAFYLANLWVIPFFLFSGVFFPVDRLPAFLSEVIQLLPLYRAIEWLRAGIFMEDLASNLVVCLFYLILSFLLFNFSAEKLAKKMVEAIEKT